MITNDVRLLGDGCPAIDACILDATGHMRTELRVVARGDSLLLDLPGEKVDEIFRLLEGFIVMEDVEMVDQTDFLAVVSVQGPGATSELVQSCAGLGEATVIPSDHTGEGGFDIYVRADHAEEVRKCLKAAGAITVGDETAETLRIEAGIPRWGVDMDEKTIPLEANLEATHISHTKGCYVGQEIIARIVARGHTNRALSGLLLQGSQLPSRGDLIFPVGEEEEREIGWVTSACQSPALGQPIALAYLRHEWREPGRKVRVIREGSDAIESSTATLPFVQKPGR
jgi:folate-binding protein YgfZ